MHTNREDRVKTKKINMFGFDIRIYLLHLQLHFYIIKLMTFIIQIHIFYY